jgi:aminopeptidase N
MVGTDADRPLATTDGRSTDHNLVDAKGHWIHAMLRRKVGDANYFRVMRELLDSLGEEEALTVRAYRETFHAALPELALETFFEQWLDRPGAPHLDLEWKAGAAGMVTVTLAQVHEGDPYRLDLELDLITADAVHTRGVVLDAEQQEFELECEGEVIDVRLDPRHHVLRWTPEYPGR